MSNSSLSRHRDFRALFDQLDGVALWTVTTPGEFDYISAGFEDIWGIPAKEVQEDVSRLLETIHPDDRDRVRENIESSGNEPADATYEGRVVRPDGSIRWVLTYQIILRNDNGEITEVVGICTDITEQKHREQELEILNRVVRHDVRNDMAIVLGWGEMLEEHVDDEGEAYLRNILDSGEHIVEVTEIARDYVEALSSNDELTVEPVSLCSVLETELSLREESFPEATFVLEDTLPDSEVAANGMLSSVFRNLLNNAVQHNDKDNPVVELSCEIRTDTAVVRIADNGPGIPDEQKDVIFGKGEKSLGSPGSGIGLYLVQTLVSQYGGEVWAEDNDPTGTVFVVKLARAT
ncbi:PAS domain-containing protein [Natronolimnobius sp. AArcel1]|uniref:PAS domain-containing sensor histidine kinase n=1 Tax=Natronolimnobius sp. AArcel1 TaxID=1679093 RepID=UPI0013ED6F6E|nr:PAS domain-containing sensor histidine kinase [Natronolimnobius sp. AArcel1]NGM67702.1 PAS domain-containing protein [Natronolimnobius sp. AArcel1]